MLKPKNNCSLFRRWIMSEVNYVLDKLETTYFIDDSADTLIDKIESFIEMCKKTTPEAKFVTRCIPKKLTITVESTPKLIGTSYIHTEIRYHAQLVHRDITFAIEDLPLYKERFFYFAFKRSDDTDAISETFNTLFDSTKKYDAQFIPIDVCIATEQHVHTIGNGPYFSSNTIYVGILLYEAIYNYSNNE